MTETTHTTEQSPMEFRTKARALYQDDSPNVIAFALREVEKKHQEPYDELDHRVKEDSFYSLEEVSKMLDIFAEIILLKDSPETLAFDDEKLSMIYSSLIGPLVEKKLCNQAFKELHKERKNVKVSLIGTERDPFLILFLMRILEHKLKEKE